MSETDSICAVIDLGELYLQIEQDTGMYKSIRPYLCFFPDLHPESKAAYAVTKDLLIQKLFEEPMNSGKVIHEKPGPSSGNEFTLTFSPNPVKGNSFLVSGHTVKPVEVRLELYDLNGKLVESINFGKIEAGSFSRSVTSHNFKKGAYIYKAYRDGYFLQADKLMFHQ